MWPALAITLREGLTAFLVVAVMLAFFTRRSRHKFQRATRWGIGLAIPATALSTALYSQAENQALWEGLLALAAAVAVAWVAWHMWHVSRLPDAAAPRALTAPAIAAITVLLITRGAMEITLLVATLAVQVPAIQVLAGATLGPLVAILCGIVWARAGQRVSQRTFAHVTAVFLIVLVLQLLLDGIHEMAEASRFPGADTIHAMTEPLSSESAYGTYAPYLLIAAPIAWWLVTVFWGHGKASDGRVADVGR
jgi:FTR1 family protein